MSVNGEEAGISDTKPHRRGKRLAAVVAGLLAAALLATGLTALALASRISADSTGPAITGSIQLNHTDVETGRTVGGQVVFHNRTSRTRVLTRGCKIDGLYAIGFRASDGYVQEPAFSLVGCSPEQTLVARPGRTVYRFKLRATYTACLQSSKGQPPKGSKSWEPLCLRDSKGERDIMPPLPAGKYKALFFPAGKWHGPYVRPARLIVTR